jgi:hypothetical protein
MSSTRTWSAGAAAVSILLVVAAWFLLIGPKRSDAAALKQQRVTQVATNQQLQLDISQLKAQSASLPAKQAELAVIQRQLPNNPALPTLIRNLSSIADQAGLTLTSIAPGAPTAVPSAGASTPANGATGSATSGTAAASATPSSVVAIPVTIITTGSYAENELFLQKLQTSVTRAFLVQGLTLAPGTAANASSGGSSTSNTDTLSSGNNLALTITGEVFVMPTTALPASTTAAGTAGSTATTPKTTGSAS